MSEHPISTIMSTSMKSIKEMIDVNTIVGDAIRTENGGVIIPVSKVSFGFAAGGGEYATASQSNGLSGEKQFPFAGGSGAGVSITPMAFMVMNGDEFRLVPATPSTSIDRILEMVPGLIKKTEEMICKAADKYAEKKCEKQKEKKHGKDEDYYEGSSISISKRKNLKDDSTKKNSSSENADDNLINGLNNLSHADNGNDVNELGHEFIR